MADKKEKEEAAPSEQAEQGKNDSKNDSSGGSSSDLKEAMATLQRRAARTDAGATEEASAAADEGASQEKAEEGASTEKSSHVARVVEVVAPVYVAKQDSLGRSYSTGKRKTSIVRVWLKRGSGEMKVNGKTLEKYFSREVLSMIVRQPLEVASCEGSFDVMATAKGGGLSGQAGALRHGISRALYLFDPDYRPALKKAGFLTRDARIVERKKYGKPKARRSFQFSKR